MKLRHALIVTLAAVAGRSATASTPESEKVREIITKVNDRWQTTNPPECRAFWDNAAYHTGNMEAYSLIGKPQWLEYSETWANHNDWQGAKSNDRKEWKYDYGEDDEHVLFGDWQICFQTYADLYRLLPDDKRLRRAKEVMEYQMSTPQSDYWWWADGLYMVMPVMTKLYNLTRDERYLDKLYEYTLYADSIMLDESGLYFRDGKYIYPQHTSVNGKKDFWARGDGWVLAGLAKVISDLPDDYSHRQFYVDKFKKLAKAVVECQQPEGYWTRSLLDPQHAPGPETSGTAFFTYGLLWGINNGLLIDPIYTRAALKGWNYLAKTALQKDYTIGYVQPIGEKAIPGQIVDRKSVTNFGTGAFLLAACEYVRYLEREVNADRQYWTDFAYNLAYPILSNMAEGKLSTNMEIEVSPNWDGRNRRVALMEAFGRLMAGLAPWLSLPDDDTPEGKMRLQLKELALKSYANAVDSSSPDYLLWEGEGQALVDAAYIAESFVRGFDALWLPLDKVTKERYVERFKALRSIDPPYTNWLLFSSMIESFLCRIDAGGDEYRVNSAIRKVEEWYVGDGWYSDGPDFAFDYYSSYVFHPMFLETLENMIEAESNTRIDYKKYHARALQRAERYSQILERLISPEGTFPVFGRSIPYRTAALQPLALLAWKYRLPAGMTPGQVRGALSGVMHSMMDGKEIFNDSGFLTIGFSGRQPNIADWYTNNGSLYLTSLSLLPLGLPAGHPFWTEAALPTTSQKAWGGLPFPKDHRQSESPTPRDKF